MGDLAAVEVVRHRLAFAVRVDDHFTATPVARELGVTLDTGELPVPALGGTTRHGDGTYRFLDMTGGPRQLRIHDPLGHRFTWDPTTPVNVPVADRRTPLVVETWPSPAATLGPGLIGIRGRLVTAAAGQRVEIAPDLTTAPVRYTRCDANGEFLFVLAGWVGIDPVTGLVPVTITVPARTVVSVDLIEGGVVTNIPGASFAVRPGGETRARFNLT